MGRFFYVKKGKRVGNIVLKYKVCFMKNRHYLHSDGFILRFHFMVPVHKIG